jgi:hypothetical protein
VTTDDILRLRAEYAGDQDMLRMLSRWQQLEQQQEQLTQTLKGGGLQLEDYRRQVKALERDQTTLGNAIQNIAGPGGKMKDLSGAAMQASYALQDAATAGGGLGQSLASASNNIAPMLLALGGPAGLTAGVSALLTVLAVAAPQIIRYLKSIGDVDIKPVLGALEELQNRIKEFDGAEVKIQADATAVEEARKTVDDLNKAIAEARKERDKPKAEEVDRGAAFREAADAAGGAGRIQDVMRAAMFNEMVARDPEIAKAREKTAQAQRNLDRGIAEGQDEDNIRHFRRKLEEAQAAQSEIRANRMGGLRQEAGTRSEALFGEAALGNQDAIAEVQARVKQAAGIDVRVFPMSGAALTAMGAENEAQARAQFPPSETMGKFLTDVGTEGERWSRENFPPSETLGKFLTEQGAQFQAMSDAEAKASEKADRERQQGDNERKRQAEQADRELERRAKEAGTQLSPWAASQIASREGTREQLMRQAMGAGWGERQAAQYADRQMRGQGFLSDDQIRQQVAQGLIGSGQTQSPEEASQLAGKIVGQANEDVRNTFAQAEQAFQNRDQAIIAVIQRWASNANGTAEQVRQMVPGFNGGRNFPPNMRRNGP